MNSIKFNTGDIVAIDYKVITQDHYSWVYPYIEIGTFKIKDFHNGKESIVVLELTEYQKSKFDIDSPQLGNPELIHAKYLKLVQRATTKFSIFYESYFYERNI